MLCTLRRTVFLPRMNGRIYEWMDGVCCDGLSVWSCVARSARIGCEFTDTRVFFLSLLEVWVWETTQSWRLEEGRRRDAMRVCFVWKIMFRPWLGVRAQPGKADGKWKWVMSIWWSSHGFRAREGGLGCSHLLHVIYCFQRVGPLGKFILMDHSEVALWIDHEFDVERVILSDL